MRLERLGKRGGRYSEEESGVIVRTLCGGTYLYDGGGIQEVGAGSARSGREAAHESSGFSGGWEDLRDNGLSRQELGDGETGAGATGAICGRGAGNLFASEREVGLTGGHERTAKERNENERKESAHGSVGKSNCRAGCFEKIFAGAIARFSCDIQALRFVSQNVPASSLLAERSLSTENRNGPKRPPRKLAETRHGRREAAGGGHL